MTDSEWLFNQTSKEAKITGRSARNKKGGSKSKGCRLPCDNMTEAEKKKLNEKVINVKPYERISWEAFKRMQPDVQKLYLLTWQETFFGRQNDIAQLLGIKANTFNAWCKKNAPELKWKQKKQSEKWREYIAKINEPETEVKETIINNDEPKPENKEEILLKVKHGHMCFVGKPDAIFTKALLMFDRTKSYAITINFGEEDENAD